MLHQKTLGIVNLLFRGCPLVFKLLDQRGCDIELGLTQLTNDLSHTSLCQGN